MTFIKKTSLILLCIFIVFFTVHPTIAHVVQDSRPISFSDTLQLKLDTPDVPESVGSRAIGDSFPITTTSLNDSIIISSSHFPSYHSTETKTRSLSSPITPSFAASISPASRHSIGDAFVIKITPLELNLSDHSLPDEEDTTTEDGSDHLSDDPTQVQTHDEEDAEDALDDARQEIEDAEDQLREAKTAVRDGKTNDIRKRDLDNAEADIERAWNLYDDAEHLLDSNDYDGAYSKANQAERLVHDVMDDLDYDLLVTTTGSAFSSATSTTNSGSSGSTGYVFQTNVEDLSQPKASVQEIVVVSSNVPQAPVQQKTTGATNDGIIAGVLVSVIIALLITVITVAIIALGKPKKKEFNWQ